MDNDLMLVREFEIKIDGKVSTMAHLSYMTTDPFAVVLTVPDGRGGNVMWTFSRELLKGGGEGDVKVTHGLTVTQIELCNSKAKAQLGFPKAEVDAFVRMMYAMVKDGDESRQIDWDKELANFTE